MSAIHHLKKFAVSVTGNLFGSSKNNSFKEKNNCNVKETIAKKGTVKYFGSEKNTKAFANEALSDFTIF